MQNLKVKKKHEKVASLRFIPGIPVRLKVPMKRNFGLSFYCLTWKTI